MWTSGIKGKCYDVRREELDSCIRLEGERGVDFSKSVHEESEEVSHA